MARTRSRTPKDTSEKLTWYRDSDNSVIAQFTYRTKYEKHTLIDSPTPGYRKRIANGEIIIGPMTLSKEFEDISSGSANYAYPANNDYQHGYGPMIARYDAGRSVAAARSSFDAQSMVNTARDLAVISAHSNIQKPDVMALVTAAELQKTIDMLKNPFSGFRRWAERLYERGFDYRRKHNPADTARMLADTWLEWRYGWRPTVLEAQGVAKLLHHKLLDTGRARSRGFGRQSYSKTGNYTGSSNQANTTWSRSVNVDAYSGVLFDYGLPQEFQYYQLAGALDVPSTAWELVRYSFVADWIVDVGSWLRAITPTLGVTNRHCWVTTKTSDVVIVTMNGINKSYGINDSYTVSGSHRQVHELVTTVRSEGVVPTLPPVNIKLDTSKVLDLVTLIFGASQRIDKLRL